MASPRVVPVQRIEIVGQPRRLARDAYHAFLTRSWTVALGAIGGTFVLMNLLFAVGYWLTDGVAHASGFVDDFFFSVQTSGTIGYGVMYPATRLANAMVTCEAIASLILTALATGLVFAKFSRLTSRIRFTTRAVIVPMNGVPTVMVRVGNERGNAIVEAEFHVTLGRREITTEGERIFRMYDLALLRDRAPALTRSWTVMHPITEWSPLFGATPESLVTDDIDLSVSVMGLDDVAMQPVHARHVYEHGAIVWGERFTDILTEREDGTFVVDLGKFDAVTPGAPTPGFPYPRRPVLAPGDGRAT